MEAYYLFNTRIIALIRVLPWAYYRLAPPGPPDFPENLAVPPGGPGAQYDTSILERKLTIKSCRFRAEGREEGTKMPNSCKASSKGYKG